MFFVRCEPPCECEWSYRFGDIHPGRACRRVTSGTPAKEAVHIKEYKNVEFEVLDPSSTHGISGRSDPAMETRSRIPNYSASLSAYLATVDDSSFKGTELGLCDPSIWTPGPIRVAVRKMKFSIKMMVDFIYDKVLNIRFGRL
jgi:predicted ester cyclase